MITITSLTHPTMIAKIRKGTYYAQKQQGHKMNGHGNRVYIENSKGRNIMRLNWVGGRQGYIVYGSESKDITSTVKKALRIAHIRDYATAYGASVPMVEQITKEHSNSWGKIGAVVSLATLLSGCNAPGLVTGLMTIILN